jgi:hypothetical protein
LVERILCHLLKVEGRRQVNRDHRKGAAGDPERDSRFGSAKIYARERRDEQAEDDGVDDEE